MRRNVACRKRPKEHEIGGGAYGHIDRAWRATESGDLGAGPATRRKCVWV